MRFLPVCRSFARHESLFPRVATSLLTLLLMQFLATSVFAKDRSKSAPISAESQKHDATPAKDSNKDDKYNVDRIGQRHVDHGFNLYSIKREQQLGEQLAATFDHNTRLVRDPLVNEYVNRLGQRLVRYSDAQVPFTIKVVDTGGAARAYGLPGGYLYVDSALILAADDEAELAGVMAHEIAHVAARHATRALTRKQMSNIVSTMTFFAGAAAVALEDASDLAGPLSQKKFSRDSEYEADLLGVEYAYAAGYDPQALLVALEKLHALELQRSATLAKIPGYHLASHIPFHSKLAHSFASYPLTEERIERLQSEISTYLPSRDDYIVDTNEFEEVKAILMSSQMPTLRRHHSADGDDKGPVLRRTNTESDADVPVPESVAKIAHQANHSNSFVSSHP